MCCCSRGSRKRVGMGLCNVASGSAGSCGITIKKPRDQPKGFRDEWDMPVRPIESGPLTDQEVEELNAFWLAEDDLENEMDVSTFDGFICAVLSAPNFTNSPWTGASG
jgi:hypothetical protein